MIVAILLYLYSRAIDLAEGLDHNNGMNSSLSRDLILVIPSNIIL